MHVLIAPNGCTATAASISYFVFENSPKYSSGIWLVAIIKENVK